MLFGMSNIVNLVVSPQSLVKECKFLFWKPGGLGQVQDFCGPSMVELSSNFKACVVG
jgi:hypothetical protein